MKTTPVLSVAVALIASAQVADAQQKSTRLSIATGGTGGIYYPLGGGLANILSKALPGVEATAEVTSASVDNIKLVGSGRADVAFVQADMAADGFNGTGKFKEKMPIRSIAVTYASRNRW